MKPRKNFIHFAAACCLLSVVTTLGIHLYFPEPPADFEHRAMLHKNTIYLANRWWVVVHCLLVIVSMWGFALVQRKKAPASTGLGFLFIAVFALAEITRQLFVLFYMNELRVQYAAVTDEFSKQNIRNLLTYAGLLTAPLFGLFILSFAIGNLCFGLGLWKEKGFSKWVSVLLVVWAAGSFISFGNHFWEVETINKAVEVYSFTFQPLMRMLLGLWLWKKADAMAR